jgi:hypothetical protein
MALEVFTLIVALAMFAAWQGRFRRFEDFLRKKLAIKRISIFYILVWAITGAAFWWFFHDRLERWEFLCLIVEVAGVTFLAREVNMAQSFEFIRNGLERLAELGEITDPREYYRKYSELDGRPKEEVEKDLEKAEKQATLYADVDELKMQVPSRLEKMNGEIADLLSKNRKRLLFLGVTLVALALWGHGVLALTQPEKGLNGVDPASKDVISQLQNRLAERGQQIDDLKGELAAQTKEIEAIKQENKHWHVVRPHFKQCTCPKTDPTASYRGSKAIQTQETR